MSQLRTSHAEGLTYRVRPMQGEDIAGVAALSAKEPAAPHWPLAEYHRMLRVIAEAPTRRGAWVLLLQAPEPDGYAGETLPKTEIVGFAMASQVAGLCDLEAVVVETALRGQRLGAALVEAAAAWGRALQASRLQLEVRASNTSALRLYERMGFDADGSRPGYYRNPDEEAVLMSLSLGPPEMGREDAGVAVR